MVITITSETWDRVHKSSLDVRSGIIHIADPSLEIIATYGLIDDDMPDRTLARPATIFIDEDGKIESMFLTENWRIRLSAEQTVGLLLKGALHDS